MTKKLINLIAVLLILSSIPIIFIGYKIYSGKNAPFPTPKSEYSLTSGNIDRDVKVNDLKSIISYIGIDKILVTKNNEKNSAPFSDFNGVDGVYKILKSGGALHFTSNRLIIPSLSINMRYNSQNFSKVSGYSTLNLNKNPNVAARWSNGVKTILAAHANNRFGVLGQMTRINDSEPNTLIIITDDSGRASYYRSYLLRSYLKKKLPEVMFSGGEKTLSLVTCGGGVSFSREQHEMAHQKNVVLLAKPVKF